MRKWLVFFLMTGSVIPLSARSFKIDTIPRSGILLNQGWKWSSEDQREFAARDFDDSDWALIDPTSDIMNLEVVRSVPAGWFRLRFCPEDAHKMMALVIKQTGASEVYFNGKLLRKFGHIGTEHSSTRGYDPMGEVLALRPVAGENVLAVRFAFPDIFLVKTFYQPNPCLKLVISDIEYAGEVSRAIMLRSPFGMFSGFFKAGVFFIFGLLHLLFFLTYTHVRANIYLAIYAFISCFLMVTDNLMLFYARDIAFRNTVSAICEFIHPLSQTVAFVAICYLLNIRRGWFFWFTVVFCLLFMPVMLRPYEGGVFIGMIVPSVWLGVTTPLICFKAYKKGTKGALVIFIAVLVFVFCFTAFIFLTKFWPDTRYFNVLTEIAYSVSLLAVPFALAYYQSLDFATQRKQVEHNLADFRRLAHEKETLLLRRNAELRTALLEGQTTERKRVATDLHDSLGSTLSALRWGMDVIDKTKLNTREQEAYHYVQSTINQAYDQVRLLSHNLLPKELEMQGLWKALEQLVHKMNRTTPVSFILEIPEGAVRPDSKTEFELYSICLELVNNILKHSGATEAKIRLNIQEGSLELTVSDNGRGLSAAATPGKGLQNISDRVSALHGEWETRTLEEGGTEVWVRVKQ